MSLFHDDFDFFFPLRDNVQICLLIKSFKRLIFLTITFKADVRSIIISTVDNDTQILKLLT